MLSSRLEYPFRLLQRERSAIAKDIHKTRQSFLCNQRNHMLGNVVHVPFRVGLPLFWYDMRSQQGGNHRSRPPFCRLPDRFQALDLGIGIETVTRLRFYRRRALRAQLLQRLECTRGKRSSGRLSNSINARPDPPTGTGDFLIARTHNALFEINQPWPRKYEVRMRVNEPRQHDLATAIEFFRFGLLGLSRDLAPVTGRGYFPASAKYGAVFNYADFGKLGPGPRAGAAAQREQLPDIG